jgi:C-terminal processing protease CtpA/Prc
MGRSSGLVAAAAILFGIASAAARPSAFDLSRFDRSASRMMLRQIKSDLERYYYDRTFGGRDIDALFTRADERIRSADSLSEAMSAISDALAELGDSHTIFFPPERITKVRYGWRAAIVGDAPYVVSVSPESDAARQGLAVGDRLRTWNGMTPARPNLRRIWYTSQFVAPQVVQHLVVETPRGEIRRIDAAAALTPRGPGGEPATLVEDLAEAFSSHEPDRDVVEGGVVVWQLHAFQDGAPVDRVMRKAADSGGLILDLRGNGGGSIRAMLSLLSRLFTSEVAVATVRTRGGTESLVAKAKQSAFTGPMAVLVDSGTASASEMAARVVQLERRGIVVGDRTAGAVMTSRVFGHSIGIGSIAIYADSITIGDVRMRDGASLEGVGVTPDETVLPSALDLANGRDPALARAIEILRRSRVR